MKCEYQKYLDFKERTEEEFSKYYFYKFSCSSDNRINVLATKGKSENLPPIHWNMAQPAAQQFISDACEEMKEIIFKRAREMVSTSLADKKSQCEKEAMELLGEIWSENRIKMS